MQIITRIAGTIITIVVGGESEMEQNIKAVLEMAERRVGEPLFESDIVDAIKRRRKEGIEETKRLVQEDIDRTPAERDALFLKRVNECCDGLESMRTKPQTDAEFLDSLRERGVAFSMNTTEQIGTFKLRLEHHGSEFKIVTFCLAEAVQWLREQVDG